MQQLPDIQPALTALLRKMIARERFPHTLLLEGADGYGTLPTARRAAAVLLCAEDEDCLRKLDRHTHPDLVYIFPTAPTKKVKTPVYSAFYAEWTQFADEYPTGTYAEWMEFSGADNKQGLIRVADAEEISRQSALYPTLAPAKVFIIWHAEKMNASTANKLLKLLEEPPAHTYFILTTDDSRQMLGTVLSRCQHFDVPPVTPQILRELLLQKGIDEAQAQQTAAQARGNWNVALEKLSGQGPNEAYKTYFVQWVRTAYMARKKPGAINDIRAWAEELANRNKVFQSGFLEFALETLRQAYMQKWAPDLAYLNFDAQDFDLKKFAPFVHRENIDDFYGRLNEAIYQLSRNAQAKLVFLNLGIEMTRLLHRPAPKEGI